MRIGNTAQGSSPRLHARLLPWVSPVTIGAATAVLTWRSWLRWPDVLVDYGQQLYVAWRLAEGEVLYRDIAYFHGPLSSYVHAGVMRLWGVGLLSLVLFNLLVVVGLSVLLFKVLASVGSRFSATAACLVFVTVFAFGQYLRIGNYNYVTPYTSEITHGAVLALSSLYCLILYARDGRYPPADPRGGRERRLVGAGLLLGLTFLTKAEVFFAAALASAAGLGAWVWKERAAARGAVRSLAILGGATLLVPISAFVLLSLAMAPGEALAGVTAAYSALFREGTSELLFYRSRMGLDAPFVHLGRMGTVLLWHFALWGPAFGAAFVRGKFSKIAMGFAWIPVVFAAWHVRSPLWLQGARPLPIFLVLLIVASAVALVRERRGRSTVFRSSAAEVLALAVFALALLVKILLNSRVYHYGFVLAMPATMLVVLAGLSWVPAWITERGGRGGLFRAVAGGLLAVAMAAHFAASDRRYQEKVHLVASGADAFWSDPRGLAVNALLDDFAGLGDEEPTLVVVPDGIMLNYLARARSPVPYLNYVPTEVFAYGEERILADLEARPPDYVAVVDKSTAEFGYRYFGQDYARGLAEWIEESYVEVGVIGAEPLTGRGFGIRLMRRRPRSS